MPPHTRYQLPGCSEPLDTAHHFFQAPVSSSVKWKGWSHTGLMFSESGSLCRDPHRGSPVSVKAIKLRYFLSPFSRATSSRLPSFFPCPVWGWPLTLDSLYWLGIGTIWQQNFCTVVFQVFISVIIFDFRHLLIKTLLFHQFLLFKHACSDYYFSTYCTQPSWKITCLLPAMHPFPSLAVEGVIGKGVLFC